MPIWLHIVLAVILTGYFLFKFIKDRYTYELLFVIWIPSTLLPYLTNNQTYIRIIGIAQVVMFILVIFFMFRKRGDHRKKTVSILAQMASDNLPDSSDGEILDKKDDDEPARD